MIKLIAHSHPRHHHHNLPGHQILFPHPQSLRITFQIHLSIRLDQLPNPPAAFYGHQDQISDSWAGILIYHDQVPGTDAETSHGITVYFNKEYVGAGDTFPELCSCYSLHSMVMGDNFKQNKTYDQAF